MKGYDPKVFEEERKTFEENREELLSKSEGQYVLIKGKKIIGIYDTMRDAAMDGYKEFDKPPFYVKKIERFEKPIKFSGIRVRG